MEILEDSVTTAYRTGMGTPTHTHSIAPPSPMKWPSPPVAEDLSFVAPEPRRASSRLSARRLAVVALTATAIVVACLQPLAPLRGRALASVSVLADHAAMPAQRGADTARAYLEYLAPVAAEAASAPVRALLARHDALTSDLAHWLFITLPSH